MEQHKSDSQKIPEILKQVVPAGYNYNKGQRLFKMKGGLWTPIFLQGGSTLRKLLGFIRYFLCKRRTSQKAMLRAHDAVLRITGNSGLGNHSQEVELGPNQGTLPAPVLPRVRSNCLPTLERQGWWKGKCFIAEAGNQGTEQTHVQRPTCY